MYQKMKMMNSGASTSCFSDDTTTSSKPMYEPITTTTTTTATRTSSDDDVSLSLLYNLSIIQDKVNQIQTVASFLISDNHHDGHDHGHRHHHEIGSTSLAMANIGTLVQGIISAASSMMFTCQQFDIVSDNNHDDDNKNNGNDHGHHHVDNETSTMMEISRQEMDHDHDFMRGNSLLSVGGERGQISFSDQIFRNLEWYGTEANKSSADRKDHHVASKNTNRRRSGEASMEKNYEIVELDAEDLLAKYTHYCQICGKGFKRDANLRMHMRAHGDEYKTREALINPVNRAQNDQEHDHKDHSTTTTTTMTTMAQKKHYYSCPQEGCRWNKRHERFQPLKSVICVKNHYKRSHCPKMYMCRRCNVKQFSVLSDLRTHEKHCGEVKWVCSCGTRFSRKDKLMSHVSLFVGHAPVDATAVKQDHHGQI